MQFQFAIAASRGADAPPLGVLLQSAFPYPIRLALCGFIAWRMLWVRTPHAADLRGCARRRAHGVPVLEIGVAELILPMPTEMLFGWAGPVLSRGCFFAFCGAWFLLKFRAVERNYGVTSEAREIFE